MYFKAQRVHFIGIGGIGMSGIAEVLLTLGYQVSGSDLKLSPAALRLRTLGATVFEGHRAEQVAEAGAVVTSSAIPSGNPELEEARRRQIPVIPRGEMLAELMRLKYGIAVAGSHGKTTTTSMIAAVLSHAGLDPTVVVGGRVDAMGSNARLGRGQFMVVESDESDRSFLKLAPILAVITTIDREHLDCYRDLEEIQQAYVDFANKVPFYGVVVAAADEPNVTAILPQVTRRVVRYGTSPEADLVAGEITSQGFRSTFPLSYRGRWLGEFNLRVPGKHNVWNAMAAVAVGLHLEIEPDRIREALATYGGVDRRFQVHGQAGGVTVVDDYGHHPTEIRATLSAARQVLAGAASGGGNGRLLVVFQPHRYSRTKFLWDEFLGSFEEADALWVTDIYPAGEAPIEGITGQGLAAGIARAGRSGVRYAAGFDQVVAEVAAQARPGDLVLALGAGNINHICEKMFSVLTPCPPAVKD
jgi:UDP-N-acetylmuramate--alanine ligase